MELKEGKGKQGMHKQLVKGTIRQASAAVCGAMFAASSWAADKAASAAPKINDPARGWDSLWHEVIVDITIIGILFAVVTAWFVFSSRRTVANPVGASPKLSPASAVGWTVLPIFIFLSIDLYTAANGWQLWNPTVTCRPTASRSSSSPACTAGTTPIPTACARRTC
jgi:heme/copper-type cytochrome/quinol oxidase subunit 2